MNISINTSIKRFLLFYITLSIVIIYGLISVVSYSVSQDELGELYDANLQQVAEVIAAQDFTALGPKTLDSESPTNKEMVKKEITSEEEFYVRVLNKRGQILYVSHPFALVPMPTSFGFSNYKLSNRKWRFYVISSNQEIIQVAQSLDLRNSTIKDAAINLMVPQLLFIPILVMVVFLAIRKALKPLSHLSEAIKNRESTELTPFTSKVLPAEIRPLIEALNMFMGKVSYMVEVIKRFTSDAAHELRTPITALKLQITLLEQASSPADREHAISQLQHGIHRAEQLVSQLLTLARIEPDHRVLVLERIDLVDLVKESIEELLPLALAKHIDLGMVSASSNYVSGVRPALKILMNNLIDNAIRYTPEHGKIDVSIFSNHQHIILEVNDSGPGIDETDMAHVFERFYRGQNRDVAGSGLGLSIVKEIADHHHANIEMRNLNPGLSFQIYFVKVTIQL